MDLMVAKIFSRIISTKWKPIPLLPADQTPTTMCAPVNNVAEDGAAGDGADVEDDGEDAGLLRRVVERLRQVDRQPEVHGVAHQLEAHHGGGHLGHGRDAPQLVEAGAAPVLAPRPTPLVLLAGDGEAHLVRQTHQQPRADGQEQHHERRREEDEAPAVLLLQVHGHRRGDDAAAERRRRHYAKRKVQRLVLQFFSF